MTSEEWIWWRTTRPELLRGTSVPESERGLPAALLSEEQWSFVSRVRTDSAQVVDAAVSRGTRHSGLGWRYEEMLREEAERIFYTALFSFDERTLKSQGQHAGEAVTFPSWLMEKLNYLEMNVLRGLSNRSLDSVEPRQVVQSDRRAIYDEMPIASDAPARWSWLVSAPDCHLISMTHTDAGPVPMWRWLTTG